MRISCSTTFATLAESSIYCLSNSWKPSSSLKSTAKPTPKIVHFGYRNLPLQFSPRRSNSLSQNGFRPLSFFNAKDESGGDFQQKVRYFSSNSPLSFGILSVEFVFPEKIRIQQAIEVHMLGRCQAVHKIEEII